jgi:glucose-1-phosphate thymidylyltransferase
VKIIIPVAGAGTRLRPHTYTQPKPLLNVAGKPILAHILDSVIPLKPSKVILIVSHQGEKIAGFVRKNYDIKFSLVHQAELLGLGHAIYLTRTEFDQEPILIILGDTIIESNLLKNLKGRFNLLGVKPVKDPQRFGIAEVKAGLVTNLVEKPERPKGNLALVGLYYIRSTGILRETLDRIVRQKVTTKGEIQLTDALQRMIKQGVKFKTFNIQGWYDCGKTETLLETNQRLLEKSGGSVRTHKKALIIPPVYLAPSAQIANSVIGPYATVLDRVRITNSIIKNSILSKGCCVQDAILENSLIGQYAKVNGRAKSINLGDSAEITA